MKKVIILLSFLSLMTLTSCDMFRKLAGRPTSSDIEAMRSELAVMEAAYQARIDSLEMEKQILADSLAALESIRNRGTKLVGNVAYENELPSRYYIVIGSFRDISNAQYLYNQAESKGLNPVVVRFSNGYNAVAVSPANRLTDAYQNLLTVLRFPFCPEDAWILFNN